MVILFVEYDNVSMMSLDFFLFFINRSNTFSFDLSPEWSDWYIPFLYSPTNMFELGIFILLA